MKTYQDINGDSGVSAYDYGDDWIKVQFKYGGIYEYQSSKIGSSHLSRMKFLADAGDGLNAYINTNPVVRNGYSSIVWLLLLLGFDYFYANCCGVVARNTECRKHRRHELHEQSVATERRI